MGNIEKLITNNILKLCFLNMADTNPTKYISLGGNCSIAFHLKNLGYYERYPFDWCDMSIFQLNNVLKNKFDNFTNLQIYKLSNKHFNFSTDETESLILKNDYSIKFAHEITLKYHLEDFQLTLQNRINKFFKLENPTFVRLETNNIDDKFFIKQYKLLYKNLSKLFSQFKLIIISKNNIKFNDNIIFIKLDDFSSDWTYPDVNWSHIFI